MKKRQAELSRSPQKISEDAWYYEERGGIEIIHELPERVGHPLHIKIPWRKVVKSASRYLAVKQSKKARHA